MILAGLAMLSMSAIPAETALTSSIPAFVRPAMMRARAFFPEPGGP